MRILVPYQNSVNTELSHWYKCLVLTITTLKKRGVVIDIICALWPINSGENTRVGRTKFCALTFNWSRKANGDVYCIVCLFLTRITYHVYSYFDACLIC